MTLSSFEPGQEEAIAVIAQACPRSTVVIPKNKAEEHAVSILRALANIAKLNKGKRVNRENLWQEMVDVTTEGVLAVGRLADADRRLDAAHRD